MVVRLTGKLICANGEQATKVRRHLAEHLRLSRAEPGCISFDVVPTNDPLVWQVNETFTDRTAFDTHQVRTRASDWGTQTIGIAREFQITED